ncbi:NAD(P)-dependent dehydrogenase (short-subunit alcohol dehydrogenase family) [Oxalobacteraceae bacterium GrIS 2.11]
MNNPKREGTAVVIGASGGIGAALLAQLEEENNFVQVFGCARRQHVPLDLLEEQTIADAAQYIANNSAPVRLIIDATGVLESGPYAVEKSTAELNPAAMAHAFAVNTIGPALLIKHFFPLLARDQRSVFATLSARVGSIGDNSLGGWYSYRASKAALNQIVRTAAVELRRRKPEAICIALHPGTVDTGLTQRFAKTGLDVQTPRLAAQRILYSLDQLTPRDSGGFFDQMGKSIVW